MPGRHIKKKNSNPKVHPVDDGQAADSQEPADGKAGPADALEQKPPEIDQVEPVQGPRIKASDLFTFKKRTLSTEARELLTKIDEGGIPLMITENLERIAKEHGIEVSYKMTPNEIVRRLRKLA